MNSNSEKPMSNAAQEHHSSNVQFRAPNGPGPALLPGIEGFYVLTAEGALGRYQSDGRFLEEPLLTESLGDKPAALLRRYRNGDLDRIAIGLVTRKTPDKPWQDASLVFSDSAVREIYWTSDDPRAPLTAFQKRNKTKSVYRGMELILDTREASRPNISRFCPVLVAPECGGDVLSRRYGVSELDTVNALEILDMMAPLDAEEQRHPALRQMVTEMTRSRIAPELRSAPELMLVDNADTTRGETGSVPWSAGDPPQYNNPWEDEPEDRYSSFNDGDPATYWLLAWFSPFNELDDLQRQFVARGHTVTKKPAGATLLERGSRDDVTLYLIEGTLELEAFDGRKMSIVGGTRRAHLPVSQLRPHAYTVRAVTNVSVIYVSQDMVREINRITTTYKSRPGIEVNEEDEFSVSDSARVAYEPGADPN